MLTVTALYAAALAALFLWLSARVIGARGRARVSLGDGGDAGLLARIRAHGNCAEYAPMGLILMAATELNGAPHWLVHALGLTLLAGRVLHALGLSHGRMRLRVAGMGLTLTMIGFAALVAAVSAALGTGA
jgi:uncharacterized membrane protein YecN with MAPEG domain